MAVQDDEGCERLGMPKAGSVKKAPRTPSARRISAVILAAGESTRFAGTKQLAELGGKTLVQRAIDTVPHPDVTDVVIVLGHRADKIATATRVPKGTRFVINEDYREGMASSIRVGILALREDTTGALLLLADQPLVTRSLLRAMVSAFEKGPEESIVAASHKDLVAPPVIFAKKYFRELAGLRGDQGARSIIEGHKDSVIAVRVKSRAVLADVDTREDLASAQRLL